MPATALVAAAAIAWISAPALGATWNVDPAGTGDAATIQEAYDLAAPGDVIVLAPGTYTDDNTRSIDGYLDEVSTTSAVAHVAAGVGIVSSGGAEVTFIDGEGVRHGLIVASRSWGQVKGSYR